MSAASRLMSVGKRWSSTRTLVENVGRLRKETSVSLARCKEALVSTNNDYEKAVQWLDQNNHLLASAKASKVGSRTAAEGLIAVARSSNLKTAVLVELNCETDFVSRNQTFRDLAAAVADTTVASLSHSKDTAAGAIKDLDVAALKE